MMLANSSAPPHWAATVDQQKQLAPAATGNELENRRRGATIRPRRRPVWPLSSL